MFKLYSEISALGRFSNGFCTEFIGSIDSMMGCVVSEGYVFTCPVKADYWTGNGMSLFDAPTDEGSQKICSLWDDNVAPLMPDAVKKYATWETKKFIDYQNFDEKDDFKCDVILKYSAQAEQIARPKYNIKKISIDDFQQVVDIYVADHGEAQREYTDWTIGIRMAAIGAGHCNFFAIWNVDKNEIAAIAGLYWKDGVYRYATVNTRKAYRGRGYCSALTAHIRDYALEHGAKELYIIATKGSQAAGIYMNAGFKISSYEYSILVDV